MHQIVTTTYQQPGNSQGNLSQEWTAENRQRSIGYVTIITEVLYANQTRGALVQTALTL